MSNAKAITKYVRISPTKVRPVANVIKGLPVEEAVLQLQHANTKGGRLLLKTLHSAIANAETQSNVQRKDLHVAEVRVDCGPTLKRAKSKCRGGRVPIMKRTSHFTIVVGS